MEMKFLRILPVVVLGALLFAPVSEAQKPLPGIQQTAQWKSMKQYVVFLQSQSSTPASQEQKQTFTNNLATKQAATNDRVRKIYSQAIQRIVNRDQRAEQKQIRKIRSQEKGRLAEIRANRSARINKEEARLQSKDAAVEALYGAKIASAKSTIAQLRRNLRKTTNPFARQVVLARIDAAQNSVTRFRRSQSRELQQNKAQYKDNLQSIRQSYALKLSLTRSHYDGLVSEVQNTWKTIYRDDVRAAQTNRQRQFQLVSGLRQQGDAAIAAMPVVLEI